MAGIFDFIFAPQEPAVRRDLAGFNARANGDAMRVTNAATSRGATSPLALASASARATDQQRAATAGQQAALLEQARAADSQRGMQLLGSLINAGGAGLGMALGGPAGGAAGQGAGSLVNGLIGKIAGQGQPQAQAPAQPVPQSVQDLGAPTRFDSVPGPQAGPQMAPSVQAAPQAPVPPPNPYAPVQPLPPTGQPAPGSLAERNNEAIPQMQGLQTNPGAMQGFPGGDVGSLLMRLLLGGGR